MCVAEVCLVVSFVINIVGLFGFSFVEVFFGVGFMLKSIGKKNNTCGA